LKSVAIPAKEEHLSRTMPAIKVMFYWKKAPAVRILFALVAGILIQWYLDIAPAVWATAFIASLAIMSAFAGLSLFRKFQFAPLTGVLLLVPVMAIGAMLVHFQNVGHDPRWFGHSLNTESVILVTLDESVVEKTNSYKANVRVTHMFEGKEKRPVTGKTILYFKKDSISRGLHYGAQILLKNRLQLIRNAGNPGGFDYRRYCLFQGITHQAYLQPTDFIVIPESNGHWLFSLLERNRQQILALLRKYIGTEKETGLAEALLIGYKNDLDKTLVQSYTKTGVVHVIAISGLHLGLIYLILLLLLKPLDRSRYVKWLKPLLILSGLWAFALMAGAQPSILRSAVMFTFIIAGESISKRTAVLNNLALSAFCLLCYNPFWLWDVGFQLSYTALLSIVIFMKPIYRLFYIKNKCLDYIWQLNAVTLAAQILTTPISIYHFHQFPVYFMLTNIVAVPLSSIILTGEIVLCVVSFSSFIAEPAGNLLRWMIGCMNGYIETIESLPFAVWESLQVSLPQTILLYIIVAAAGSGMMQKRKTALPFMLLAVLGFLVLRDYSFSRAGNQRLAIVYNLSRQSGIDIIDRRRCYFHGDSTASADPFNRSFHFKPAHTLFRVSQSNLVDGLAISDGYLSFGRRKIVLLSGEKNFRALASRPKIDLLVISRGAKPDIAKLARAFDIQMIVFDGSVSRYKLPGWIRDCESAQIPYHDVTEKGAFVMNLN
jgi:competence protein ComEC